MGQYRELDEKGAIAYAKDSTGFFQPNAKLSAEEIGDGNINWVYRITDSVSGKTVIFKQALPYVRIVGDSWPLSIDRSRIEAETARVFESIAPDRSVHFLYHNSDMAVSLIEDLGRMKLARYEMMCMKKFPLLPRQMGSFLAEVLIKTSDLGMDPLKKKRETARFCNPELAKMVEDLVFDDPFWDAPNNKLNPALRPAAEAFWSIPGTRIAGEELKLIYMQKAECLIHGDLHTGSFFVTPEELRIFDAEFAFYGPSGYDMGCVIGNLLLNWASWAAHPEISAAQVLDYRKFMEAQFIETYTEFAKTFSALWETAVRTEFKSVPGLKERYLLNHMRESVGFPGCECARRSVGLAQVPDTSRIEDLELRAKAQRISLQMATHLLADWKKWEHIEEVSGMLKRLVV